MFPVPDDTRATCVHVYETWHAGTGSRLGMGRTQ